MPVLDAKIPEGPLAEKWTNYKASMKLVNPANKKKLDVIETEPLNVMEKLEPLPELKEPKTKKTVKKRKTTKKAATKKKVVKRKTTAKKKK